MHTWAFELDFELCSYAPPIHPWRYSPFRDLASLIRRLHSSLFAALVHPVIPSSCRASLWTTSAHLVLGLPTGLVIWKFPFKTIFGILCSVLMPRFVRIWIYVESCINQEFECVTTGVNSALTFGRILIGVKKVSCKCCRGEGFLVPTRYRLIGYSHAVLVGLT